MPFNVLLLPLLGGYVFITYWNHTRFSARRYSGERLLIHAALAGVCLLVLSYTIVLLVAGEWPKLAATWSGWVPFKHSGSSLGALLLGATLWWPLNLVFKKDSELRRTISDWNDYLEELLTDALDSTRQVSITLNNGKVYVGFVVRTFDPAYDRKYIVILPTMSGYREATTHQLIFNTDYTRVYQALIAGDESRLVRGVDDFQIVVPVSYVASANLFDWEAYQRFNDLSEAINPEPR
jgi:hypothetical protein